MTQMIPVSDELYEKLQRSARQRGLALVDYLELVTTQDVEAPSQETPEANIYEEIASLNIYLAEKYPHLKDVDVTAWIREDRER